MSKQEHRGFMESHRVMQVPVGSIRPNPSQPRRIFEENGLQELAHSIANFGILQPLTVRRRPDGYELVAGERRLRASKLAGLREVPCILLDVDSAQSGAIALVENLQRRDLDFVEQAQGMARLIQLFGLSQEECARRLGMSQSAVANKLRLLKLPEDILTKLVEAGFTERHGRALLRLSDETVQRKALSVMLERGMTVAAAEAYVESLLVPPSKGADGCTRFVMKDVRVFMNSLHRGVELMRRGGVDAEVSRRETEQELTVTIRIRR